MIHELVCISSTSKGNPATKPSCPAIVAQTTSLDSAKRSALLQIATENLVRCAGRAPQFSTYFLHLPLIFEGQPFHLVERGGSLPTSSSQFPGCYSQQLLLSHTRSLPAGPAALLKTPAVWSSGESLPTGQLPQRELELPPVSPRMGTNWARLTGDAGWGGLPLAAYQRQSACLLRLPAETSPEILLDLLVESQSLLEPRVRWEIPFAYQAWLPEKARSKAWLIHTFPDPLRSKPGSLHSEFVLDLTQAPGEARNAFAQTAREGSWSRWAPSQSVSDSPSPASGNQFVPVGFLPHTGQRGLPPANSTVQRKTQPQHVGSGIGAGTPPPVPGSLKQYLPWIAAVGGLAIAFIVGWYGLSFISAKAPPPEAQETPASAGAPLGQPSRRPEFPPPPPSTVDANSGIARLLSTIQSNSPAVPLPGPMETGSVTLLRLPANFELLTQLEFGLALPDSYLDLTPSKGPINPDSIKQLKLPAGEAQVQPTEIEFRLKHIASSSERYSLMQWQWLSVPTQKLWTEWQLGAWQISTSDKHQQLLSLPLTAPLREPAKTLLQAIHTPLPLAPHLPEQVWESKFSDSLSWTLDSIRLAGLTTPPGEDLLFWHPPHTEKNPHDFFSPDRATVRRRLLQGLGPSPTLESERVVEELLKQHWPLGLAVRLTPPNQAAIARGDRFISVIVVLSARNPEPVDKVFSTNPASVDRTTIEAFQQSVTSSAKAWVQEVFKLNSTDQAAIAQLADQNTLSDSDELPRLARCLLAAELLNGFQAALDSPLQFRILRRTRLQSKRGPMQVDIPAVLVE